MQIINSNHEVNEISPHFKLWMIIIAPLSFWLLDVGKQGILTHLKG
tara:strand:+ start:1801 stop:1938 length:138 start_codon:yes stop_codon:yes gene_type:complete